MRGDYIGESTDLEVGRYGLRTFSIVQYEFSSVVIKGLHWSNGTCIAACVDAPSSFVSFFRKQRHEPPSEGCGCGIYATHTLAYLKEQYPTESSTIIAVIAAEGQTLIGDRGFRTERARVVAYWCKWRYRLMARQQFVDAKRFSNAENMAKAFNLK